MFNTDDQLDLADATAVTGPTETGVAAGGEEDAAEDDEDSPSPAAPAEDDVRQVPRAEAEAYAKECGLLFFEASAKTGANVGEVFTEIGELLIANLC